MPDRPTAYGALGLEGMARLKIGDRSLLNAACLRTLRLSIEGSIIRRCK